VAPARHDPLTGEGTRRYGGRWTSPGRLAVYLAAQLPLAALEVLAHVDADAPPLDLTAFAVDVPAELGAPDAWAQWDAQRDRAGTPLQLPLGWRDVAQPLACRAVGDAWHASDSAGRSPLLRVPTALLPDWAEPAGAGLDAGAWCAVLDAAHPHAVRVAMRAPFAFDPRLLR
jgi:RES domain-containing protein